jgi:hypothetical protein
MYGRGYRGEGKFERGDFLFIIFGCWLLAIGF